MSMPLGRVQAAGHSIPCPACNAEAVLTDWQAPWQELIEEYCCPAQHVTYRRSPVSRQIRQLERV